MNVLLTNRKHETLWKKRTCVSGSKMKEIRRANEKDKEGREREGEREGHYQI